MSQQIADCRFEQDEGHSNLKWSTWLLRSLLDLRELPPTLVCSVITTVFTLHAEGSDHGVHEISIASKGVMFRFLDFLLHPSPAVMIWACVILGCSVSSFVFRHRRQDRFQALVFGVVIAWVVILAYGIGSSLNLILLGFVPCSLTIAMLLSSIGHSCVRFRHCRSARPLAPDEKGRDIMKV